MIRDSSGTSSPFRPWGTRGRGALVVVEEDPVGLLVEPGPWTMPWPKVMWRFMASNSSSVSPPGLRRMASATPILTTSCSSPARRTSSTRSGSSPSPAATPALISATVSPWLRV
jgi:hypothetical protein